MYKGINSTLLKEHHRFLARAALFEGEFSVDWIPELEEMKASQIISALEEGINKGWLVQRSPGIYHFTDVETRQRLQESLASDERERFHRHIFEVALRETPDEQDMTKKVAVQLLHIQNDMEGCRWLLRAGKLYRKKFQIEEAIRCFTKVIQDLKGIDEEEANSIFIEAAIEYSKVSEATMDLKTVISTLKEASNRAKNSDKKGEQALLEMHLAKNEWISSHYNVALAHYDRGCSIANDLDDSRLQRPLSIFHTFFPYWYGRFRDAVSNYERIVPDVEKFPHGRFPLLAGSIIGLSYGFIGQVTQGLGMLDSIYKHSKKIGDIPIIVDAAIAIGRTLFNIRRTSEALNYLEEALKEARPEKDSFHYILVLQFLAYAYFLKGDYEESENYLTKFIKIRREKQFEFSFLPYLHDICWAIEQGNYPHMSNLSLENEIAQALKSRNVLMEGVAYKYMALIQQRDGEDPKKVEKSFNRSLELLEESGHQMEIAWASLELGRFFLKLGNGEKAKKAIRNGAKILSSIDKSLIFDDLRHLIKDQRTDQNLLEEILQMGQEVVTIRENRELVQHILSTANRITGAERAAIFLLDKDTHSPELKLRAARNLTADEIAHPRFKASMKLIQKVAKKSEGRILEMVTVKENNLLSGDVIRSCICLPMIIRDKVVGVLYHDNRLLRSVFKESDLRILSYFAAQAAIAMDNANVYEEIQELNRYLKEEKQYFEEQHQLCQHFEDFIGKSPGIMNVLKLVDQVAGSDTTVLILGETGVGKEVVARAIHQHSPRRNKPFIGINCSTFPESLISSELFGHEKGAFTGANERRIGRFELANGGTLFLDEIGDIPMQAQVRLLRVLQSKEFERVGGRETLRSDFRLLAATNQNLEKQVKAGHFRSDLYYRLNVFPIHVPPLRERKEDIPLLAHYFLKRHSAKMGKPIETIPKQEMDKLLAYNWPGNVRELENVIERGTILSSGSTFRVPELGNNRIEYSSEADYVSLEELERNHILNTLHKTKGKIKGLGGAAEILRIHPNTLYARMKKLGIQSNRSFSFRK
ncbi:sigma 54-interacting transcriptional regulator [Thermodesulfobacteriota bacterium]